MISSLFCDTSNHMTTSAWQLLTTSAPKLVTATSPQKATGLVPQLLSSPLHSLSMSVEMPVAHVTWQWRFLGLTLLRRPARTPKLSSSGIVPLSHTHFSASYRKKIDYCKYRTADPQRSVFVSSWNWCCRETEAGNTHVFLLSLPANRKKYFSFPTNPKRLYNTTALVLQH